MSVLIERKNVLCLHLCLYMTETERETETESESETENVSLFHCNLNYFLKLLCHNIFPYSHRKYCDSDCGY